MKNKPLKIIFDTNPLVKNKSGIGYFIDGLIRSLSLAGGDNVELVGHYFNFLGRKKLTGLPTAKNIHYVESKVLPGKLLSFCRKIGFQPPYELFTRTRGDITLFTNFALFPTFFKSKRVVFIYDLGFIDCPEFIAVRNLKFLKKWAPRAIQNADAVVVNSAFTKKRIVEEFRIPETRLLSIPIPPITIPTMKPESLKRFNIPGNYLLFVGTIEPRKNINTLLDAYAELPRSIQLKYSLVLTGGKGWNDHAIVMRIQELQDMGLSIIQTGYVSDGEKATLYKNCLFCIQPSFYEGFGMPILEAMSYGKAVICSDIEVFHEVANDSVKYFESGDPSSLASSICRLIENPVVLLAAQKTGMARLKAMPTWDDVAADFLNQLEEILH